MNFTIVSNPYFAAAAIAIGSVVTVSDDAEAGNVGFKPAPVIPLASQPPASLIADAPLPEPLARGYVVIRYRAENLRFMPVYGPSALGVLPRIGHLHITLDDLPWHWLDASGEPLSINGLPPGSHKLLIELQDPTHKLIDSKMVSFEIPPNPAQQH
ncbi:MAG: DUF6130 family protein [Chthoniobacteraceae bacterium]